MWVEVTSCLKEISESKGGWGVERVDWWRERVCEREMIEL